MTILTSFASGRGAGRRQSHMPPITGPEFIVQSGGFRPQHFPFQPLPKPRGNAPFRYDLSRLLAPDDITNITDAGVLVFHTAGDTGDQRGRQQDFVAEMMTEDAQNQPGNKKPAFFYHLGDVVYFAGDVDKYGDNFYETYKNYPAFIVSIPGNHDCQPDDPQDGPVNPNKFPLDGWVQNFMSDDPSRLGSLKTDSHRTQVDLPNVYWTFTTPLATIIGLFSNVSETEGEFHQDQIDWFRNELTAASPDRALLVAVHHPPYSGDIDHSGSSTVAGMLFDSFQATGCYPHLILSGHVHNYQRFTKVVKSSKGPMQIPCLVAGAAGYTKLGKLHKIKGNYPKAPLRVGEDLTLEQYDQDNFGFLRFEVDKNSITGTYVSAPYTAGGVSSAKVVERFQIELATRKVTTLS